MEVIMKKYYCYLVSVGANGFERFEYPDLEGAVMCALRNITLFMGVTRAEKNKFGFIQEVNIDIFG